MAKKQNFYSAPWQRIGELLPVRITEKELIVYGPDVKEIARHELCPMTPITFSVKQSLRRQWYRFWVTAEVWRIKLSTAGYLTRTLSVLKAA